MFKCILLINMDIWGFEYCCCPTHTINLYASSTCLISNLTFRVYTCLVHLVMERPITNLATYLVAIKKTQSAVKMYPTRV